MIIENARIVLGSSVMDGCIAVDGGKIIDVAGNIDGPDRFNAHGMFAVPGFIDAHVHGGGHSVMT